MRIHEPCDTGCCIAGINLQFRYYLEDNHNKLRVSLLSGISEKNGGVKASYAKTNRIQWKQGYENVTCYSRQNRMQTPLPARPGRQTNLLRDIVYPFSFN